VFNITCEGLVQPPISFCERWPLKIWIKGCCGRWRGGGDL